MSSAEDQASKADFSLFCYSLASQAMAFLGGTEDPESGEPKIDLPNAKHLIDILAMLQRKTEGNLTEEEAKVLSGFLYDLRMRYVDLSRTA